MELEHILSRLVEGARQVTQADAAMVRLLNKEGTRLNTAATLGFPPEFEAQWPDSLEQCPLDEEALDGRTSVVADACTDPRGLDLPGGYRAAFCVPLMNDADCVGTLHVYTAAPRNFGGKDADLLAPLAELGAAAIAAARSLEQLEALEASRSRFIRVATHELRSPVAVAQSLVRGVLKGYAGELGDKQAETFKRISRRLDFLESLVNDLLDLAAGKAPELSEEEGPVAINSSVGRAVLLIQPRAEEKGVDLIHRVCCEELVVWGTEEGLDRIFVNLIENAVKYTPSGGEVIVSSYRDEDEIHVQVADTGIGIPKEAREHLFEEFYRAPNAKALGQVGTGLGLTIVKDLVDRYGGSLEVESEEGEGSTFTVTFPIYRISD